jgi:hypothetical protein
VKYVNQFNDGNWLGNLYTFDGRVSTEVGDENTHTTIGKCLYTDELTDNCENCRYSLCNARLIATEKAYRKHLGFCSQECYESARQDGFVKDVLWDKFDYKAARSSSSPLIKGAGGILLETGISKIQAHLDRKLANVEWKYVTSQKEEDIVEC